MNKKILIDLIKNARFIFVCGNGGSAATAEHFVTDLVKKGYKAICLNSQNSVITMIANDYGYDKIFSKQLEVYASEDDLLITISCSGTSKNIEEALKMAFVKLHMSIHRFPTFGKDKNYGKLEDTHLKIAHEVAAAL